MYNRIILKSLAATYVCLPVPPSVNQMYMPSRGRMILTPVYRKWRQDASYLLNLQKPKKITQNKYCVIHLMERASGLSDCDNRQKAMLDLLVKHKITKDDKHCSPLFCDWIEPSKSMLSHVFIFETTESLMHALNESMRLIQ